MSNSFGYKSFMSAFNRLSAEQKERVLMNSDSTGYFGSYVNNKKLGLAHNQILACIDERKRPVIVVNTKLGNIVIFKRHDRDDCTVLTTNHPPALNLAIPSGNIGENEDAVLAILGTVPETHMGFSLDELVSTYNAVGTEQPGRRREVQETPEKE